MLGILADANSIGYVQLLLRLLLEESRKESWLSLQCSTPTFAELGLAVTASEREVWQVCQERELVLLTENRNARDPDSLETVIRELNTAQSLPVFTLANTRRLMRDREYAGRVADKLLDYLSDIDNYRGTGRLYLP